MIQWQEQKLLLGQQTNQLLKMPAESNFGWHSLYTLLIFSPPHDKLISLACMRKAIISGVTGQDGSYVAELLLSKDYEVHGITRRFSTFPTAHLDHIYQDPHEQEKKKIATKKHRSPIFRTRNFDILTYRERKPDFRASKVSILAR